MYYVTRPSKPPRTSHTWRPNKIRVVSPGKKKWSQVSLQIRNSRSSLVLVCRAPNQTLRRTQEQEINACAAASFLHVAAEQVLLPLLVVVFAVAVVAEAAAYIAGGARLVTRREHAVSLLAGAAAAVAVALPVSRVRADENGGNGEGGVVDAIKSIFDPNEETKVGKVLPKAYLKAAREVVKTLRESLEEDAGGDVAKFRRGADSAKVSIREFLGGWRGQQAVAKEESYVALEKAIRSLAEFYSKAGPFASLPPDVKNKILDDLNNAEAYL